MSAHYSERRTINMYSHKLKIYTKHRLTIDLKSMAKGASSAKQGRSLRWFLVAFFRIEIELFERLQFNNIFLHMKDNEVWRKKKQ